METLLLQKALVLAVLAEVITNLVKTVIPNVEKAYITTIAGLIGIILSWLTCIGLFATLGIPLKYAAVDYLLTGVIISRGANIVHDLAKRLNF